MYMWRALISVLEHITVIINTIILDEVENEVVLLLVVA